MKLWIDFIIMPRSVWSILEEISESTTYWLWIEYKVDTSPAQQQSEDSIRLLIDNPKPGLGD